MKLCGCGCGEKINPFDGRGRERKYLKGHEGRGHYRRVRCINSAGYEVSRKSDDLQSDRSGYVLKHVLLAEKALGKPLPHGSEVHHVNGARDDNTPGNLVICQDRAYHRLLHRRAAALKACGHANWLKCKYCQRYDAPENLSLNPQQQRGYHKSCAAKYSRERLKKLNDIHL